MVENKRIVLVGAGNLATSLALALKERGVSPVAIWSRTMESACELGKRVGCSYTNDMSMLPDADIVIISVADASLPKIASEVATMFPSSLILHTAGSIPLELLHVAGCKKYGVFYPMQTFSKARVVDFTTVSVFVEGCDCSVESELLQFASDLGGRAYVATSEQRRFLHLAAVFACNFSNAMYAMSERLLTENGLPFDAMLPLIDETAAKVHHLPPRLAQTGPAQRGDSVVMNAQRQLLDDELGGVYDAVSRFIMNNKN